MKTFAFFLAIGLSLGAQINGVECPGLLVVEHDNDGECCVGGKQTLSNCDGWPICKGPVTVSHKPPQCATRIATSESNYDALITSASSMYLDSDGKITSSADGSSPKETGSSKSSGDSSSSSSSSSSSDSSGDSSSSSGDNSNGGSPTNGAAMVAATAALKAGAVAMVYAAL